MKAIIIDDEQHVREAIHMLIDWESYGIEPPLQASNGHEAMTYLQQASPELIFLDMMMPGMHGTLVLEWIHDHLPNSKTIVISGHDDFSYVRHTIQYGGVDYLLKPIDADELRETIERALNIWHKEKQKRHEAHKRNIEANQASPAYWDKQFSNLLHDSILDPLSLRGLQEHFEFDFETVSCSVGVLSLLGFNRTLMNRFGSNRELLYFSLSNICNELIRKHSKGYAFRYAHAEHEIVIVSWSSTVPIKQLLKRIHNAIDQTFGCKFHFGYSEQLAMSEISEAYRKAREAIRQRNVKEINSFLHSSEDSAKLRSNFVRFEEHKEQLLIAVRSGNTMKVKEAVKHALERFRQVSYLSIEMMEMWWEAFTLFQTGLIHEVQQFKQFKAHPNLEKLPSPFILPVEADGTFNLQIWEDQIEHALLDLSQCYITKTDQDFQIIPEIKRYIEHHYTRNLTLQEIASHFYLSREYISRRFKQETGRNISDYIAHVRNEKAKLLLANPNFKIVQIAQMVGYQDEKYFSKVFKKMNHVSPNEYRKALNKQT